MRQFIRWGAQFVKRAIASSDERFVTPTGLQRVAQTMYLRRVIRDWEITGIVDVGANNGQFAASLRRDVGFSGPIVSVEPIPALAEQLIERAKKARNWKIEQLALGASPGSAIFNITNNSEFSSLLHPIDSTTTYFRDMNAVSKQVKVSVATIDELLARHSEFLGPRVYLKLDTQGYDLEVLKGLNVRAIDVSALQTEASLRPLYEGAPDFWQAKQTLENRGFTISATFPNNAGHYPYLIEFDCHFVNIRNARVAFNSLS